MTQVEKIKAEVESLYAKTSIGLNEYTAGYENGKAEVCGLLLNLINSMQKELECEDLELASERYACKFSSSKYGHDKVKDAVVWGANWQKEQMMAKAVDGEVGYWNIRGLSVNMELPSKFEEGDKVKVIIIKED
jgi:hypothetical protein